MRYNYKNVTVNVTTSNPNFVQLTGETTMTLKSEFVAELLQNSCTFFEFFTKFEIEELYTDFEEDDEKLAQYFQDLDEEVSVQNADAIIAVYEYALDNEQTQFNFEVETENISWVIHDILHATFDTAGCTVYVESSVERERIIESLNITKEQFPSEMPDFQFLENLENEYHHRFNKHLNLDEFKYLEEEY